MVKWLESQLTNHQLTSHLFTTPQLTNHQSTTHQLTSHLSARFVDGSTVIAQETAAASIDKRLDLGEYGEGHLFR